MMLLHQWCCAGMRSCAMQAALLRGTALRGQRPTKRQRLRRELLAQRLGLALQVGAGAPCRCPCQGHLHGGQALQ